MSPPRNYSLGELRYMQRRDTTLARLHRERMEKKRKQGKLLRGGAAGVGVVALAAGAWWGIAEALEYDGPTAYTYCATDPAPGQGDPRVVDDANCAVPSPGYQVVEQAVPDDDSSTFVFLAVGDTYSRSDRAYKPIPKGSQVRAGSAPARLVRPTTQTAGQKTPVTRGGAVAAAPGGPSTISRGGLGVSTGGAKGGSSASSGS